jgi:spore coat polysaccharide biosynthesis protein SpsF (cytidylyltransferase family)
MPMGYDAGTQIGIVIQARMTSKRFPGKSLELINGKSVLQHVIERCKLIRAPGKIKKTIKVIVAVPDMPQSEPLGQLAAKLGVDHFCGPEGNVLERYYGAASFFNLDIIVRITADCPLIDPKICSEVLQLLMWRKVDYASNCHKERTFPKGLDCEVFTFECLEATYATSLYEPFSDEDARQQKYDQEHVTPLMIRHEAVKKALVKRLIGNESHLNYCVDVPSDIAKIEKLLNKHDKKSKLIIVASNNNDNPQK